MGPSGEGHLCLPGSAGQAVLESSAGGAVDSPVLANWRNGNSAPSSDHHRKRTQSLNRPQRERLPCFKAGISVVKEVKLTVVIGASERFPFSES